MTLFLRNDKNETLVDINLFQSKGDYIELRSVVCINTYSTLLINILNQYIDSPDKVLEFIRDFNNLQELRGWLWETYFMVRQNTNKEFPAVLKAVKDILSEVCKKYNLYLVID